MRRKISLCLLLLGGALTLSACDKCGDFQEIRVPGQPHACKDASAR